MDTRALLRDFSSAKLALTIEPHPLDHGRHLDSIEIVQLDIAPERYRLFPGNLQTNLVEVAGVDRAIRQLVLLIDEPRRTFTTTVARPARGRLALPADVRVVAERDRDVDVEVSTSGQRRHLLCGMDEAHLFIARLPRPCASVRDAHDALRPDIPPQYERGVIRRQGEWFFLPVTGDERSELNALSPRQIARRVGIAEAARQRRRGRPHVATEVCVLDPGARIYARGEIRHPDHASLALRGWHRVLPNREFFEWIPARRRARSVHWVD